MIRKRENRYRRNPLNINLQPIPTDFNSNQTDYLTKLQSSTGIANKVKNEKGNDIPIRINGDKIQVYKDKEWSDLK